MLLIRKATLADIPVLVPLFDAYRGFYRRASDPKGAARFLTNRIDRKEAEVFLALEGPDVTGFALIYPQFSSTRMGWFCLLNDLFVAEEHRGKGISKKLITAVQDFAIETRAEGVLLETEKTNRIANRLYPRAGFSLYSETNFYWWENAKDL